jgi:hypothetical protein
MCAYKIHVCVHEHRQQQDMCMCVGSLTDGLVSLVLASCLSACIWAAIRLFSSSVFLLCSFKNSICFWCSRLTPPGEWVVCFWGGPFCSVLGQEVPLTGGSSMRSDRRVNVISTSPSLNSFRTTRSPDSVHPSIRITSRAAACTHNFPLKVLFAARSCRNFSLPGSVLTLFKIVLSVFNAW